MSGHYAEDGRHICTCGEPTVYQSFSGGREFYCEACDGGGYYPEGEGGPQARLLATKDGSYKLRRRMYDEIARRKTA